MNNFTSTSDRDVRVPPHANAAISNAELAKFLTQLAGLYDSPEYGNASLAAALLDLALVVKQRAPSNASESKSRSERVKELSECQLAELKGMNHEAVRSFISDESKTKDELLSLASARFAMPVSQLRRMKSIEVRQALTTALLHESSIEILSEEAGKDGAARNS